MGRWAQANRRGERGVPAVVASSVPVWPYAPPPDESWTIETYNSGGVNYFRVTAPPQPGDDDRFGVLFKYRFDNAGAYTVVVLAFDEQYSLPVVTHDELDGSMAYRNSDNEQLSDYGTENETFF